MPPTPHRAVPASELAALRAALAFQPAAREEHLRGLGMRSLSGGRNNLVYAWDSPDGPVCLKVYKTDQRRRAEREWHALTLLAAHGVPRVPRPLWRDPQPDAPAVGMSMLPGTAIPALPDPAAALRGLTDTWQVIHRVPLSDPLADLVRVDSAAHYAERITDIWTKQLADHPDDPLTRDLCSLLDIWWDSRDGRTLAEPQAPAFSQGDANLLNWLHDPATGTTGCVDFEFAGASDPVFDAADLIEHISARAIDDTTWADLAPDVGLTGEAAIRRFHAARHTCALRWLAVLWRQRASRVEEFNAQLDRVRRLQHHDSPLAAL